MHLMSYIKIQRDVTPCLFNDKSGLTKFIKMMSDEDVETQLEAQSD